MPLDPTGNRIRRLRIGKYQVITHIATGGMGAVYKAEDVESGREVALKVLSPELAANPIMLARFRREAGHAQKLNHENIVTLYDWGQVNGIYYLALEFVDGIDLHEYVVRKRQLDVKESRAIIIQAVRALAHLYKTGIVHRDIKPSNFLVTQKDGRPFIKLIDLGLAREANEEEFRLTRASHTLGTVDYMAPEQARDSGMADVRSDIYSLGCTWYHMLAGAAPFAKGSLTERIFQHSEAEPPDIRQFNRRVPKKVIGILGRMLAKNPADRYQTPAELLRDLESSERPEADLSQRDVLAGLAQEDKWAPDSDHEISVPVKPVNGSRPRLRDEETGEVIGGRNRPAARWRPVPWLWAGAAAAGLAVLITAIVLRTTGSHGRSVPKQDDTAGQLDVDPVRPEPEPPKRAAPTPVREAQPEPVPKPKPEAPKAPLRRLYEPRVPIDARRLWQELGRPRPPAAAQAPVVYRLSRCDRGGDGRYFPSLAEACAAAPPGQETVIEIDDNGPLFELPAAVQDCSLVLRAGKGYRPLVAWDVQRSAAGSDQFLSVAKGNLTLENLDVVCKASDSGRATRPVLFRVADGFFSARDCSFSVASRAGMAAVRLETTLADPGRCKCRLDRCYMRGSGLVALDLRAPGAEVLLNGCLVAGGGRPLIKVAGLNGLAPTNIRVVRSTLVAGQTLLAVRADTDVLSVALRWHCWDTLLACSADRGGGDMVALHDDTAAGVLQWEAVNCLYAGWQTLLKAKGKTHSDLASFRSLFTYSEGDVARPEAWPPNVHPEPAEVAPEEYATAGTPVCYAASSGAGALGCDLAALPALRDHWLRWSYERFVPAPLNLQASDAAPLIPAFADGLYHGEALNLDRVDLGAYLDAVQKARKLGPRVVLHLSGTGTRPTSPVHIKGSSLVLYFQSGDDAKEEEALTLKPDRKAPQGKQALIEVEDGDLDIRGGRIEFPDLQPLPPYMLRVSGGHLLLSGCRLRGVPSRSPESFQGLVSFAGSGKALAEKARGCVLRDCVLMSARSCVDVAGTGAQVQVDNCVLLAGTDVFHLAPGRAPRSRLNVQCVLEHNTVGAMRAAFYLVDAPGLAVPAEPIVVQADANVFVDPFAKSPGRAGVLLAEGDAIGRGLVVWQGTGNVYGKRLHFYGRPLDRPAAEPQPYAAWTRLWGGPGEVKAVVNLHPGRTLALDSPKLSLLALPPLPAPTPKVLPGADLKKLGIVKEKAKKPRG